MRQGALKGGRAWNSSGCNWSYCIVQTAIYHNVKVKWKNKWWHLEHRGIRSYLLGIQYELNVSSPETRRLFGCWIFQRSLMGLNGRLNTRHMAEVRTSCRDWERRFHLVISSEAFAAVHWMKHLWESAGRKKRQTNRENVPSLEWWMCTSAKSA